MLVQPAEQFGECLLARVVEVMLLAEEQHLVLQKRGMDGFHGGGMQIARQADAMHFGAEFAADAANFETLLLLGHDAVSFLLAGSLRR